MRRLRALLPLLWAANAGAVTIAFQSEDAKAERPAGFWPAGMELSLSSLGYYKGFSGDPRRASGNVNRMLSQDDLTLRYRRERGGIVVSQDLAARHTNDRTLSPHKDFILQSFFLSVEKPERFGARLGNILPSFSRFTLGTSLEGLSGFYRAGPVRASAVAARQEPVDGRRFRRWTSGSRLEAPDLQVKSGHLAGLLRSARGGVSVVSTADEGGSIRNTQGVQKLDALVYGADASLAMRGNLALTLEGAGSSFRDNRDPGRRGFAASADLGWRPGRLSAGLGFENQDPLFRSPSGSASPDSRRLTPRAAYRLAEWAGLDTAAEFTRNNLRGQLAATTLSQTYRSGLSLRPLGWLRRGALSGLNTQWGLRLNRQRATDGKTKRQTINYDLAASHSLGGWSLGAGYSLQDDRDLVAEANNRVLQSPKFNLGWRWQGPKAWNLSLGPTLAWSYSRDTKIKTGEATKTTLVDLGLGGTVDGARFNFGFGTSSSQRPAPANAAHQTRWKAEWNQNLLPGLSLSGGYNYNWSTEADATRNYAENQWSVGLRYAF